MCSQSANQPERYKLNSETTSSKLLQDIVAIIINYWKSVFLKKKKMYFNYFKLFIYLIFAPLDYSMIRKHYATSDTSINSYLSCVIE